MTDFEFRQTAEQPTAAIRMTRPVSQIGPAMGEAFPKLYHAVVTSGVEPAGMPLSRYFDFGPEETTFECAIPFVAPFAPTSEVQASSVGGGEAACALHVGPYDTLSETWQALTAWVAEQGRQPSGPFWEIYLNEPQEVDASELKTELYIPLA